MMQQDSSSARQAHRSGLETRPYKFLPHPEVET